MERMKGRIQEGIGRKLIAKRGMHMEVLADGSCNLQAIIPRTKRIVDPGIRHQ